MWADNDPKIYYKDGAPYGLIAMIDYPALPCTYIAATTTHPSHPFTLAMIKDIIKAYKAGPICIIMDDPLYHDHLRRSLLRYNMRYETVGTVLYAYNH